MTVVEVLTRVFELLAPEGGWRQGEYAGRRVGEGPLSANGTWSAIAYSSIYDVRANCYCLGGAIDKVCGVHNSPLGLSVRDEIRRYLKLKVSISTWNDAPERTQDDVLSAVEGTRAHLLEGAVS